VIGPRPGETFHEEIMTEREATRAYENDTMFAIPPEATEMRTLTTPDGFEPAADIVRSSKHASKLSQSEIVSLLETNEVIPTTNE